MSKPRSEEQQRQYEKRAKRRAVKQFHCAVSEGNLCRVQELLLPDLDVNFYYNQESALQIAVCKGHLAICEILIENGADTDQCDVEGHSLLNMATWRGHYYIAELLVEKGCELNQTNVHGSTALNTAVFKGRSDIAAMLSKKEACDINKVNKRGQSPLNSCCDNGNEEIARQLIDAGADLNLVDKQRRTPLITAAENGYCSIVEMLTNASCNLDMKANHGETAAYMAAKHGHLEIIHLLNKAGADLDICDNCGSSPFHQAVHGQHLQIVTALAKAGANVNLCERDQKASPLHTAVRMCCHYFTGAGGEHTAGDLVRLLLDYCDLNAADKQGWTPLYHAAFGGELEVVKLLLERNVDVNQVTESLDCLLHAAVFGNSPEIMRLLLQAGCKVNHLNKRRELPLYTAIDHRAQIESIQLLLDAGSELDVCETEHGHSPLFAAIHQNNAPVVQLLINAGASVNQQSRDGDTALWLACSQGNEDIVTYLLEQPNISVDAGISHIPLHTAVYNNYAGIVHKLLQAGCDVNKLSDICTSALYYAADGNHLGLTHLLIHYGADVTRTAPPPRRCCRLYRDAHPHLELQPLYCAVRNDNFAVLKLLLVAAPRVPYDQVRTLHELVFRTGYAQEARLSQKTLMQYGHLFLSVLHQPRGLREDCRGVIRRLLGNRPHLTVPKLPLPSALKDYLLMKSFLRVQQEESAQSPQ